MKTEITSTKDLERVLGKKDLLAIAVGQIIGAGIFSLLPQAIGLTGRSASLAFVLAAVLTLLKLAPRLFVLGTVRMRGGSYTYVALLSGKILAGSYLVIHILSNISLSMYSLSIGQYLAQAVDGINVKFVAILVLTIVTVVNLIGVKNAARVQQLLVLCLMLSLAIFTLFGVFKVNYLEYFKPVGFFTNGPIGFCSAAAILTFACGGAQNIINFSAEAKNPIKDMPIIIIISTIIVSVFYAFMAIVATGVLPIQDVMGQTLSLVASKILPGPLYVFFLIGGAMFALLTTLNAQLGWCTKPLLQGCVDGWLPKSLGKVNNRFKTPHVLILLFYFVGLLPLIFDFNMNTISGTAVFASNVIDILLALFVFRLPKVIPDEWKNSKWHTSNNVLWLWTILGTIASIFGAYMSLRTMTLNKMIINLLVCIVALLFGYIQEKRGKVNMEISYERQ
ncbi:APC family permease [Brachyspira intermedia]|uniref:APC family permease n=1 Tax=Brachyspira intermedia TaxID=84377 RepID=UPI00300459A6